MQAASHTVLAAKLLFGAKAHKQQSNQSCADRLACRLGGADGSCVSVRLQVLESSLEEYKQRHADENTDPDEMILSAGDYLLRVLEPVQQQRTLRNYILMGAAGAGSVLAAGLLLRRLWSADSSGSTDSKGSSSSSSIQTYQGGGNITAAAGSSEARELVPGVGSSSWQKAGLRR